MSLLKRLLEFSKYNVSIVCLCSLIKVIHEDVHEQVKNEFSNRFD